MSVHAVVVGIERYDCTQDGIDLDLDGPASDAVRFSGLMLERGAAPENIHLFMNALDMNARQKELAAFKGGDRIRIQQPVRDTIEAFFDNVIPKLDGDTLYLLWGGHGVMRDGMERHLFYENIRKTSPLTFWLDKRLAQLRRRPNFSTQNIFIDACANYVELTEFDGLSPTQVTLNGNIDFVTQHTLCAAASGERAANDTVLRSGLFTDVLLKQFRKESGWPSAKDLQTVIMAVFKEREKTDPRFRQHPVFLEFTADDGGLTTAGHLPGSPVAALAELANCAREQIGHLSAVMSAPLSDRALRDRLFEGVLGMRARTSAGDAAQECAELGGWALIKKKTEELAAQIIAEGVSDAARITVELERARRASDIYEMLHKEESDRYSEIFQRVEPGGTVPESLEEMLSALTLKGPLKRSKLICFVLEMAEISRDKELAQKLHEWAKDKADASFFEKVGKDLARGRKYRILLSVTESANLAWGLRLRNGVAEPPRRERPLAGEEELLPALEQLYKELISDLEPEMVTSVELILKPNHLCLNLEAAGIPLVAGIPTDPLCRRWPVALRWRDRILRPGLYHAREWRDAARKIAGLAPNLKVYLLTDPAKTPPEGQVLDLGCVPKEGGDTQLAIALYTGGVPYAFWQRTPPAATYAAAIRQIEACVAEFGELPQLMPEERGKHAEVQAVALFWDDPETDPRDFIKSYEEQK